MIVVDASVAVKWLIPEAGEEAAKKLLAQPRQLLAPSLIRIEVAGAVLRAFRENRLNLEEAKSAIFEWQEMLAGGIVHMIADDELYTSAVEIGLTSRHALQDCLYLAVAQAMKAKLITADRPMFERGGKAIAGVRLLDGA